MSEAKICNIIFFLIIQIKPIGGPLLPQSQLYVTLLYFTFPELCVVCMHLHDIQYQRASK